MQSALRCNADFFAGLLFREISNEVQFCASHFFRGGQYFHLRYQRRVERIYLFNSDFADDRSNGKCRTDFLSVLGRNNDSLEFADALLVSFLNTLPDADACSRLYFCHEFFIHSLLILVDYFHLVNHVVDFSKAKQSPSAWTETMPKFTTWSTQSTYLVLIWTVYPQITVSFVRIFLRSAGNSASRFSL